MPVDRQGQHPLVDVGDLPVTGRMRGPVPGLAGLQPAAGAPVRAVSQHVLSFRRKNAHDGFGFAFDEPRQRNSQGVQDLDERFQPRHRFSRFEREQAFFIWATFSDSVITLTFRPAGQKRTSA